MRVLITGGRDFSDVARLTEALDAIHAARPITELIHGAATGADTLAGQWAERRGISTDAQPADWDNIDAPGARIRWSPTRRKFYNANAGFQRNLAMLATGPDLVIAFPGGTGTAHCTTNALKLRIAVMSVDA